MTVFSMTVLETNPVNHLALCCARIAGDQTILVPSVPDIRCSVIPALAMVLCMFISYLFPVPAFADDAQSQQSIRDTVQNFLQQQLELNHYTDAEITVAKLDSRLKMSRCDSALQAFLPQAGQFPGKLSVGVQCATPRA